MTTQRLEAGRGTTGSVAPAYLDGFPPVRVRVGYGELGVGGSLGYEGKAVAVGRRRYQHAFSTHPPARLLFYVGGRFAGFHCQVALNDDVPAGASHADFIVLADGRQVAAAPYVLAGQPPRALNAAISGAQMLELVVTTSRWEYCHAVWVDPQLSEAAASGPAGVLRDCLERAEIDLPIAPLVAERCIATVVSPEFVPMVDDMLGSLNANGNCPDALLVVFVLGATADCAAVAAKYRGVLVPCRPVARIDPTCKSVMYSVARIVEARQYLCLDGDMLVLGDLRPAFSALEALPEGSILACREGNSSGFRNLRHALSSAYGGSDADLKLLTGGSDKEGAYPLVVNDGFIAGSRSALLALDGVIRAIPQAASWVDQRPDIWWRNQFIFNLALARLECGVELDPAYNLQLHVQDVRLDRVNGRLQAEWHGHPVRALHFGGQGRHKLPEWRGLFARVPDPLVGSGRGDGFSLFASALRAWVGRRGTAALGWSFYGTAELGARVADADTLPLLALLHYLIRSNGCVRVLECGTGRGVSTACLASAVAHRPGASVVSFDPYPHPDREELWATLPDAMRDCIEPRVSGSLEGMAAALSRCERYEAALLDSVHTGEHVWAEFQLATRLVCPGGLILIHDACYVHGTVEAGLRRIEEAGYGVVRLWTAEDGEREDNRLGLAVIENRCRSSPRDV